MRTNSYILKKIFPVTLLITFFLCPKSDVVASDTVNVLFIGNSYTYVNDLPSLFTNLSASGGKTVVTDMSAPGGYAFEQHVTNSETISKIQLGIWNFVVLQEQSQMPVIEYWRYNSTYPSAFKLDSMIKASAPAATTVFYMTWGRRNGGQQCVTGYCSPDFISFFHMQDSLKSSYSLISYLLNARLSPAGEAWRIARQLNPNVNLWDTGDSHPTLEGSYLTACVFYAAIFNQSPVGLSFNGGLLQSDALFCQQCAWQSVLYYSGNEAIADNFSLGQNYPNPFNNSTIISYNLNKPGIVNLVLFDILGRQILNPVNEFKAPGKYQTRLDLGNNLASGIYYYRLTVDKKFVSTKKLMLIK